MKLKTAKYFYLSICAIFLMSLTFLFMPLTIKTGRLMSIIIGSSFWLFLIIGYALVAMSYKTYKQSKYAERDQKSKKFKIRFFKNVYAKIFDILFAVSVLCFAVLEMSKFRSNYIAYIMLFLTIFSLNARFLFNSKMYEYIKSVNEKTTIDEKQE